MAFFKWLISIVHCLYKKWTLDCSYKHAPPMFSHMMAHMSFHLLGASLVKLSWLLSQTISNQWANLVSSTFKIHPKFNHFLLPSWPQPQTSLIWVIFLAGPFCPYLCPTLSFLNRISRVVILKISQIISLLYSNVFDCSPFPPNLNQKLLQFPTWPSTIWSYYLLVPFSVSPLLMHSLQTQWLPCCFSNTSDMFPSGICLCLECFTFIYACGSLSSFLQLFSYISFWYFPIDF